MEGRFRRFVLLTAVVGALATALAGTAAGGTVLILDTTVTGGASSYEAQAAIAAGHSVEMATPAQWAAKTAADFGSYDALILGDPTCGYAGAGVTGPYIGAAEANRTVWSPQIDGNIVVIGTDEVFHHFQGGAQLTTSAVKFAADEAGKTGLMISLSCYYHDFTGVTHPIPVLDQFGTFTSVGVDCYNDAHIVATHPALAGLTDASLSNWSCSVHNAFAAFPSSGPGAFLPLAIARNVTAAGSMSFPDGSFGIPYILARGKGLTLISTITLGPDSATNEVGTSHTLTATVEENGTPVAGVTVTFTVVSGPHAGLTGTGVTDSSGVATFTYTGTAAGTDVIEASYTDSDGKLRTSNQVTKTWEITNVAPNCDATASGPSMWPPNHKLRSFTVGGATDPDGDPVSISITGVTQDEPVNGVADGNTAPDAFITGSDTVDLRAERAGTGDGRVYTIWYTASDGNGGSCSGSATVGVPHDQGNGSTPIDSGQLYNSLLP